MQMQPSMRMSDAMSDERSNGHQGLAVGASRVLAILTTGRAELRQADYSDYSTVVEEWCGTINMMIRLIRMRMKMMKVYELLMGSIGVALLEAVQDINS